MFGLKENLQLMIFKNLLFITKMLYKQNISRYTYLYIPQTEILIKFCLGKSKGKWILDILKMSRNENPKKVLKTALFLHF